MAVSLDDFIQRIDDSGLMAADDVRTFVGSLPEDQSPADGDALAKVLVSEKKLTPFQAQQLWKGRGKGLVLGDYAVLSKLGQGGMGEVYKAQHQRMQRVVALKILPPSVTKDQQVVQRFEREVIAAAKLSHPNIVTAHDASEQKGVFYLVMEYVEGKDLSAIVKKQGPTTVAQAVDFVLQAARGLEYAHKNGVVHRDIKPANLLLDNEGTVKILDMGLARIEDDSVDAATQAGLTGTGTIMGTIDYMAPEQAEDTRSAGPQADIYSLGASLYYLLMAKPVVAGETVGKKLRVLITGVGFPDSLSAERSDIPPELDAVFRRMTALDMGERYESMTDVIADLEAIQSGGTLSTTESAGVAPVAAGRSDESAINSFVRELDDGTSPTAKTVVAKPQTDVEADTFASSVAEMTRPALSKTVALGSILRESKQRNLLINGSFAAVLLLGAIIWGFSGGENKSLDPNEVATKISDQGDEGTTKEFSEELDTTGSSDITSFPDPDLSIADILTSPEWAWTEPENLGPNVNSKESDGFPAFSADGLSLVFSSGGTTGGAMYAFECKRRSIDETWSPRKKLDLVNYHSYTSVSWLSPDGLILLFGCSHGEGLQGKQDLFRSIRTARSEPWQRPVNLGAKVNSSVGESSGKISADGLSIFFQRYSKEAGKQLWQSIRNSPDSPWQDPVLMALTINADGSTCCPVPLVDGKSLLFARFRSGAYRIYLANSIGGDDFDVQPIDMPIEPQSMREFWLMPDGKTLYFMGNHPGGFGDFDIWMSRRVPKKRSVGANTPPPAIAPFDEAQAKAHQQEWADYLGLPVETTNSIGMKFVVIPPGEFLMGDPEKAVHVALAEPYRLGVHEVTQGQWLAVMKSKPDKASASTWIGENYAAPSITWPDASAFCQRLTERERLAGRLSEDLEYRLPTEAEWEFACRAGTTTEFSFGDDEKQLSDYAWFGAVARKAKTPKVHLVGLKKPNAWNLYGMHGNLKEWCQDRQSSTLPSSTSLQSPVNGTDKVARGGCWYSSASHCRSASRDETNKWTSQLSFGFRVVLSRVQRRPPPPAVAPFDEAKAKAHQKEWADYLGEPVEKEVTLPGGEKMAFMLIPPGEFMMGSTAEQHAGFLERANAAEDGWAEGDRTRSHTNAQHLVRITQPFYLGKFEVTQAQWQSEMGSNPSNTKEPTHPVEKVDWDLIRPFLEKLNTHRAESGGTFALPTEAQWEYACRAGTKSLWYFGYTEAALDQHGWISKNANNRHRGGQLRPNPFGLYDMYGNMAEWCADWYAEDYYAKSPVDNPVGPPTGTNLVLRGGSSNNPPRRCSSVHRNVVQLGSRYPDLGFRVAMTIDMAKLQTAQTPPTDSDRAAAEWVIEIGGRIVTDIDSTREISSLQELPQQSFRVRAVDLGGSKQVTDANLNRLDGLTKLEFVQLYTTQIGDAGLERFKELTTLVHVNLNGTQISDAGLVNLKGLTNLTVLTLKFTNVTTAGVTNLQKALPNCKITWDGDTKPDRAAAEWVLSIGGSLKVIDSSSESREVKTAQDIPKSPFHVTEVAVNQNQKLTDGGLKNLVGLTKLTSLNCNTTPISDEGLVHLKRLNSLQTLGLYGTKVTDAGLAHVSELKELRSLVLENTSVTDTGVAELKKRLPNCKVSH